MTSSTKLSEEQKEEVLKRARSGDQQAIEDLAYIYGRDLEFLCRSHVRNPEDANDILQDAWIKIVKALPSQDPSKNFLAWSDKLTAPDD